MNVNHSERTFSHSVPSHSSLLVSNNRMIVKLSEIQGLVVHHQAILGASSNSNNQENDLRSFTIEDACKSLSPRLASSSIPSNEEVDYNVICSKDDNFLEVVHAISSHCCHRDPSSMRLCINALRSDDNGDNGDGRGESLVKSDASFNNSGGTRKTEEEVLIILTSWTIHKSPMVLQDNRCLKVIYDVCCSQAVHSVSSFNVNVTGRIHILLSPKAQEEFLQTITDQMHGMIKDFLSNIHYSQSSSVVIKQEDQGKVSAEEGAVGKKDELDAEKIEITIRHLFKTWIRKYIEQLLILFQQQQLYLQPYISSSSSSMSQQNRIDPITIGGGSMMMLLRSQSYKSIKEFELWCKLALASLLYESYQDQSQSATGYNNDELLLAAIDLSEQQQRRKKTKSMMASHPWMNVSSSSSAMMTCDDPLQQAECLWNECLGTVIMSYGGEDHPVALEIMNHLGNLYFTQSKFSKAKVLYSDCLKRRKRLFGDYHEKTLHSIHNLGLVHFYMSSYVKAERVLVDCIEKMSYVLGKDHPATIACMKNLEILYEEQPQLRPATVVPPPSMSSASTYRKKQKTATGHASAGMKGGAQMVTQKQSSSSSFSAVLGTNKSSSANVDGGLSRTMNSSNDAHLYFRSTTSGASGYHSEFRNTYGQAPLDATTQIPMQSHLPQALSRESNRQKKRRDIVQPFNDQSRDSIFPHQAYPYQNSCNSQVHPVVPSNVHEDWPELSLFSHPYTGIQSGFYYPEQQQQQQRQQQQQAESSNLDELLQTVEQDFLMFSQDALHPANQLSEETFANIWPFEEMVNGTVDDVSSSAVLENVEPIMDTVLNESGMDDHEDIDEDVHIEPSKKPRKRNIAHVLSPDSSQSIIGKQPAICEQKSPSVALEIVHSELHSSPSSSAGNVSTCS